MNINMSKLFVVISSIIFLISCQSFDKSLYKKDNLPEREIKDRVLAHIQGEYRRLYSKRVKKKDFDIKEQERISYFLKYRIYDIYYKHMEPTVSYTVAIGSKGDIYLLKGFGKNEFNKLVKANDIAIKDLQEAVVFTKMYLKLTVDPDFGLKLLNSVDDINTTDTHTVRHIIHVYNRDKAVYSQKLKKELEKYRIVVKPLIVQKINNDFGVNFWTWEKIGGFLKNWRITVKNNGELLVKNNLIVEKIGSWSSLR